MPVYEMEVRRAKPQGREREVVYRAYTGSAALAQMFTKVYGERDAEGCEVYFAVKPLPKGARLQPTILDQELLVQEKLDVIRRQRGLL